MKTPRTDALRKAWEEADRKHGCGMRVIRDDDPQDIWDFARQLELEVELFKLRLETSENKRKELVYQYNP